MLLDTPKAYTDYSQNYHRIVPNGYNIEEITHGTNADPNLITVEEIIKTINRFKNEFIWLIIISLASLTIDESLEVSGEISGWIFF